MIELITVTGTFPTALDGPARGEVLFALSTALQDPTADRVYAAQTIRATLDDDGKISVPLVPCEDPALQPTGAVYTVTERVGVGRTYDIIVSADRAVLIDGVPTIDLADVAPVVPGPLAFDYVTAPALAAEANARAAADQQLQDQLDNLEGTPEATTTTTGTITLAGDLAGTADAPTVPALAGKASTAALSAETAQRQDADTALTDALADEAGDRQAADTTLTAAAAAAQATADAAVPLTQKGAADGVATLGPDSKIPSSQLPPLAITETFPVSSQAEMLALDVQVGDVAVRTDLPASFILRVSPPTDLASWQELQTPTDAVLSVDGQTGAVVLPSDAVAGTASKRTLGAGPQQAAAGNDPRLSDARTPTAHAASHGSAGADPVTPAAIGAETPVGAQMKADAAQAAAILASTPRVALDIMAIPVADMSEGFGTPARGLINRTVVWLLDGASNEIVGGTLRLPDYWNTMHVDAYCVNAGVGAGNLTLRFDLGAITVGAAAPDPPSGVAVTVAAGVQNIVMPAVRLATGLACPDGYAAFEVARLPQAATDTLTNDIGLIGLILTKAS